MVFWEVSNFRFTTIMMFIMCFPENRPNSFVKQFMMSYCKYISNYNVFWGLLNSYWNAVAHIHSGKAIFTTYAANFPKSLVGRGCLSPILKQTPISFIPPIPIEWSTLLHFGHWNNPNLWLLHQPKLTAVCLVSLRALFHLYNEAHHGQTNLAQL